MSLTVSPSTIDGQQGRTSGLERLGFFGVHGPRFEPDHGPRYYKPDHGPHYELDRLDLVGHAASGSGPSSSRECDADISGVERVEVGGYGEPNRDEPGSTKMCRYGKVALSTAVSHVAVWGICTAS